jgi:hypothetical protein
MNRTRIAALAGAAAMVAAGCSTTTTGTGTGPVFTEVSGLAAQMSNGLAQVKTAQGRLHLTAGPVEQTSTFREAFSGGDVTALDDQVSTSVQGTITKLHVIYVDQKLYVDRGHDATPWVIATPGSSDRVVATLAASFKATLSQSGAQYYTTMTSAGHDLKVIGSDSVDGVPSMHYHLTVDPRVAVQKLPAEQAQQMQAAVDAGVDAIPVDVWVDGRGRPVRLTDEVSANGQTANVELRLNHFDQPITIQAPPADQIDQG